MRTHKRLIDILDPSSKTVDALVRLQLPSGVDIEIKVYEPSSRTGFRRANCLSNQSY